MAAAIRGGLSGEQIPLGARIFAIADTLDAITSDRPYRKGRSFPEASREIERCSGRQFDPAIVEVFLSIPLERWSDLRAEIAGMSPTDVSSTLCRPDATSRRLSAETGPVPLPLRHADSQLN